MYTESEKRAVESTPEGLNVWAERLLAAALDREAYKQPGWHSDAMNFLAAVKAHRRHSELNEFAREFSAGFIASKVHVDPPTLLGDADVSTCVARTLGAAAGVVVNSAAPSLDDELESFYTLAAGLLQAMDEAGAIVRRDAFEADQHLVRRVKELEGTLADVLGNFREKGNPGESALRTHWVAVRHVDRWHRVQQGLPPEDDTAVLDTQPGDAVRK